MGVGEMGVGEQGIYRKKYHTKQKILAKIGEKFESVHYTRLSVVALSVQNSNWKILSMVTSLTGIE